MRISHWALVASFAIAWYWKSETFIHETAGKAVLAIVLIRLGWGVIGPNSARFSEFVANPQKTFAYLQAIMRGRPERHLGHNPAGAAMIAALLLGLIILNVSGILMGSTAFWGGEWIEWIHGWSAYGLLALIIAHVAGVVIASIQHRENLPLAMVTGSKTSEQNVPAFLGIAPATPRRFATVAALTFVTFGSWLFIDTIANASYWRLEKMVKFAARQNGCEIAEISAPRFQYEPALAFTVVAKQKTSAKSFVIVVPGHAALAKKPNWPERPSEICPNV